MKTQILFVLTALSIGCDRAVSTLDDALYGRPGLHTQDIDISNQGQQSLAFGLGLGAMGDCYDRKNQTLNTGQTGHLHVEQVCRGKPRAFWWVELARTYGIATYTPYNSAPLTALTPGQTIVIGNNATGITASFVLVVTPPTNKQYPFPIPKDDRAGEAWISANNPPSGAGALTLNFAVDQSLNGQDLYLYALDPTGQVTTPNDPAAQATLLSRTANPQAGSEVLSGIPNVVCDDQGCN